jgi:hypothetical protein
MLQLKSSGMAGIKAPGESTNRCTIRQSTSLFMESMEINRYLRITGLRYGEKGKSSYEIEENFCSRI